VGPRGSQMEGNANTSWKHINFETLGRGIEKKEEQSCRTKGFESKTIGSGTNTKRKGVKGEILKGDSE